MPAGKSRGDFLFEIGCEEIPAGMILKASRELKALLQKHFLANGLLDEKSAEASIETFGAPRRLVAIARSVRMSQEDVTREITGPPKSVAYDQVGEPTRAAMSFAEKQGIPVSKLSDREYAEGRISLREASGDRQARRRRYSPKCCRKRFRKFPGHVRCIGPERTVRALFGRFAGSSRCWTAR